MPQEFDPWKNPACASCGSVLGAAFHQLDFYLLPTKLLRARHKKKSQCIYYCSTCYDGRDRLSYLVDGNQCPLGKVQRLKPAEMLCPICIKSLDEIMPGLYGLIVAGFWVGGSCIESWPVATFCGECVESHDIQLPTTAPNCVKFERRQFA